MFFEMPTTRRIDRRLCEELARVLGVTRPEARILLENAREQLDQSGEVYTTENLVCLAIDFHTP